MRLSRRIRIGLGAASTVLVVAGGLLWVNRHDPVPRVEGPLPQQVFVWQRDWGSPVKEGIERSTGKFDRYLVLAAEVGWESGRLKLVEVGFDGDLLSALDHPIGLAFRIGPYSGRLDQEWRGRMTEIATSVIEKARAQGVEVSELQIDFDCPESKLRGYRELVQRMQTALPSMPVTITALPAWLDQSEFARLASQVPDYVLQVHSLRRPRGPNEPFSLCDPLEARSAVDAAARVGVPFRVALPTYGYRLAFDSDGEFVGLTAEGPRPPRSNGALTRVVRADPAAMASLGKAWQKDRPEALQAIVWYRLPIRTDRLNWSWPTLKAILNGKELKADGAVRVESPEPGLVDLVLTNRGNLDLPVDEIRVQADYPGPNPIALDGLNGFRAAGPSTNRLLFRHPRADGRRLPPKESIRIGWIRFDGEPDLSTHVSTEPSQ